MNKYDSASARPSLYKTLFATCVGNALEWFDIAVYGFFASYIARSARWYWGPTPTAPAARRRCCCPSA